MKTAWYSLRVVEIINTLHSTCCTFVFLNINIWIVISKTQINVSYLIMLLKKSAFHCANDCIFIFSNIVIVYINKHN